MHCPKNGRQLHITNTNGSQMMIFLIDRVENITGKGEKCWLPGKGP